MVETRIEPRPDGELLVAQVPASQLGLRPARLWNPSPTVDHRTEPYEVPKRVRMGIRVTEESGAKFSPPPFAVVVEEGDRRALVAVSAEPGWHLWNQAQFAADGDGAEVTIDLEGHTDPAAACPHVALWVLEGRPGEARMDLLARGMRRLYPDGTAGPKRVPSWWLRPSYCGWGDQVALSMHEQGLGREGRAGGCCTQENYERWVRRLEDAQVPVGTVTIDAGWSAGARLEPDTERWPDLGGFIRRQHQAGRRVLLWAGTWGCSGLPEEWRVPAGDGRVCVDSTNPDYRAFLRRQLQRLISPDGYDADGFKIDQLARCPSERPPERPGHNVPHSAAATRAGSIRLMGPGWGCELLYRHQKDFYDAAKSVKPDALVTSSTVHPYFHDTFDMIRLHDTQRVPPDLDIMDAMGARAALARAALPGKPIDTDDWVSRDYEMWMRYTTESHRLGVPCIFYTERFMENWDREPATRPIPLEDLRRIGRAWAARQSPAST